MKKQLFIAATIVGVLLLLAGILLVRSVTTRMALARNERLWAFRNIQDYRYTLEMLCFCPGIPPAVVVQVRGGAAMSVTARAPDGSSSGLLDLEAQFRHADTVDKLFDLIEKALDGGGDILSVRYDEQYGYPTRIKIDRRRRADDDDVQYTVTEFEILDGPAALLPTPSSGLAVSPSMLTSPVAYPSPILPNSKTAAAYAPPPTRIPPTSTIGPTRTPTITPVVPGSLPPSAYYAWWAEVMPCNMDPSSTLWRGDPGNTTTYRQIVYLAEDEIAEASFSPNGEQLVLGTRGDFCWHSGVPALIWVVGIDGNGLEQLNTTGGGLLWYPDGRSIYYVTGSSQSEEESDTWVGLERIDLLSGETRRIFTLTPVISAQPIGWSADGQWLYQIRLDPSQGDTFELWKTRWDGSSSEFVISLGEGLALPYYLRVWGNLTLSSDQGKLLIGASQHGIAWVSTDGQENGAMAAPLPDRGLLAQWGQNPNELIVMQSEGTELRLYILDVLSQTVNELAHIPISPGAGWDEFYISPDYQWVLAHRIHERFYWIHVPTGAFVPVANCSRCEIRFIGWTPVETSP